MESCDDCAFVYADLPVDEAGAAIQDRAGALAALLAREPADLRRRPAPDVWSPLEYACHVRDVLVVQRARIALALAEDCPDFVPMGREELLVRGAYNEQDPAIVAGELMDAATAFAAACAALDEEGWARTGIYNWPAPAERALRWLARHTFHEVRHHHDDVRRALGSG